MQKIYKVLQRSEKNYKKDRTKIIIFIDEANKVLDKKSSWSKKFEKFIKTCSQSIVAAFLLATNHPLNPKLSFKINSASAYRFTSCTLLNYLISLR